MATAIRLAADYGPDRVTTQHLADAVGVTQPAIFRHFATKNDIWLAVGDHIVNEMGVIHSHPVDLGGMDAHDMLHRLVGHHFVHISQNPAIPAILFSRELQTEITGLREKFATLLRERREAIEGLIRMAQANGQHDVKIVAEDVAHLVMSAIHGLSMRWLLEDRSFDLAEEGNRVIGALLDGLRG
ncbi:TetR/AcrR family transcriptional regulator [Sinisalibacter aestuarii]|uniref:TetR/AcrR family transcriptional regulator n=1 Tax=Sinisalibacter aestuarii TaxID=2949426 RepID=UPI00249067F9|nr:TetR/AcrR family transcriptional regulator [Sinisalibacter aestuarii]